MVASLALAEQAAGNWQVTVGVVASEAPMQSWQPDSPEPVGYDIDLLRALAAEAGMQLRFERFENREQLVEALSASSVDLMASATVVPALSAKLSFSQPYRVEQQLMVSRQEVTSIPGNPDLTGRRLAVVDGTSGAAAARQHFPFATTRGFASLNAALDSLSRGDADMLMAGRPQLLMALEGGLGIRVLKTYTLPEGQLRFAARPDAGILVDRFDALLAKRPPGADAELADRWLNLPAPPVLSIAPLPANQPGLRVGYFPRDANSRPLDDGTPTGVGIDLMKAVARHAGMTIAEFQPVNLSRGLDGLENGSLDVLIGLTETEDRRKTLGFVGPYHASLLAIISRTGYGVPSLDQLKGRKLAMIKRFFARDFVSRTYPGITVVDCDNSDMCMEMVERGEAEATIYPMNGLQERLDARGIELQISGVLPRIQDEDNLALGPHSAYLAQRLRAGLDLALAEDMAGIEQQYAEMRMPHGIDWKSLVPWGLGAAALVAVGALAMWWHLMLLRRQVAAKQQAREQAEAYLGFMTHEVRNALQSVAGASVLLNELEDDADAPPAERKKVLQLMTRSSRSTMTLMDALMDRYQYVQGKVELKPDDVDVVEMLQQLVDDIAPAANAKRLKLDMVFDPRACGQWRVDPVRVQQVLRNLIINAVKFTREGGITVEFSVDEPDDVTAASVLRVAVSDTGDGMDEAARAQVFERFHSKGGDRPGTGLGLALCRDLAQAMDGELELDSAPGKGSTFTLVFEAYRPEHHSMPPEMDVSLRHVLIVDGSPVYGLLLKRALGNHDVEAVLVESVRAASEEIQRPEVPRYDLVVVESSLIDGTSEDIIRLLEKRFGEMPHVVVLGQATGSRTSRQWSNKGVLETMAKTSDVYGLVDRITQAFKSAQLRRMDWGGVPSRPPRQERLHPQSQL